jgi:hypothetical protein
VSEITDAVNEAFAPLFAADAAIAANADAILAKLERMDDAQYAAFIQSIGAATQDKKALAQWIALGLALAKTALPLLGIAAL